MSVNSVYRMAVSGNVFSVCEVEIAIFMYLALKVLSFFQENAVDLHSLGRILEHPGGNRLDPVKGMSVIAS